MGWVGLHFLIPAKTQSPKMSAEILQTTQQTMKISFGLIFFYFLFCQNRQDKNVVSNNIDTIQRSKTETISKDTVQLEDVFIDSLNIGRRKFNKIEVFKYRATDSNFVDIKFYIKQTGKWKLNQTIHFLKDGISGCDTKLSDFNNDRLNDMTIVSSVAARGANEVRRLFVYNKSVDKLIEMKNSENYPNMLYNKDLNCIDAFLVYSGSSTVFLKINGDSLKEFASVEAMDGITVREFDKYGMEKIIFQDTTNKADYIRFKTYIPLKEYDHY